MTILSPEQALTQKLLNSSRERTHSDKLIAKDDIEELRQVIRKDKLEKEDVAEILYLIASGEIKLVNFKDEWQRYVVLKYYVWLRATVNVIHGLYDYLDYTKSQNMVLSTRAQVYYIQARDTLSNTVKQMVDLYCNVIRSSLSVDGMLIKQLMKEQIHITGDQKVSSTTEEKKKGWFK